MAPWIDCAPRADSRTLEKEPMRFWILAFSVVATVMGAFACGDKPSDEGLDGGSSDDADVRADTDVERREDGDVFVEDADVADADVADADVADADAEADADADHREDGDVDDVVDADPEDSPDADCGTLDTDGDGVPDNCDECPGSDDSEDSDHDGVPDGCDLCPGVIDGADADEDGTPNCLEECPLDATKLEPGVCGCGLPDEDTDGDGAIDCAFCTVAEGTLVGPHRPVTEFECVDLNSRSPTFEERIGLASLRGTVWLAYMGACG